MKSLILWMLPAILTGGAAISPAVTSEINLYSNSSMTSIDAVTQMSQGGQGGQDEHPGKLQEEEETKGMTTRQRLTYRIQVQTQLYAELIEAQANLEALLSLDTSAYTEEEMAVYNAQVEEAQSMVASLEEAFELARIRTRLTQGEIAGEAVQARLNVSYPTKLEALRQQRLQAYYEMRAGLEEGFLKQTMTCIADLSAQIEALEAQLVVLYETDITAYTEEELASYNAQIEELEAQIIALNEELLTQYNTYRHANISVLKAQLRLHKKNQLKSGIEFSMQ